MEKKIYEIELYGKVWKLELKKGIYNTFSNLAIEAVNTEDGDPFAILTVNLGPLEHGYAYIDTNNCEWAPKFLKANKIAKDTGLEGHSGYCTYPLYKFNEKVLDAMRNIA